MHFLQTRQKIEIQNKKVSGKKTEDEKQVTFVSQITD